MTDSKRIRVVYISYDGMEEPLGKSQVLAYLKKIADYGFEFELISFEKPPVPLRFRELVAPGVRWTGLRYHKTPTVPATAFDMAAGASAAALLRLVRGASLIHVRSYVAGVMGATAGFGTHTPLLFDMRGLWADERIEDGVWSADGGVYRGAKKVERLLVRRAQAITTLTNSMAHYLREEAPFRHDIRAPVHVIPTCTDLERFHPTIAPNPAVADQLRGRKVLTYVGSLGGRYLSREMAEFYVHWRQHVGPASLLVVSRQEPEVMREVLGDAGCANELLHVVARPEEVPSLIRCADAGLFFHPPTFTNRGAAPTKGGEMLASGLPVAGNLVGDVPAVIRERNTGVVVEDFEHGTLADAAFELARLISDPEAPKRARKTAERWFSLDAGVKAYADLYRGLISTSLDGDRAWPRPESLSNNAR